MNSPGPHFSLYSQATLPLTCCPSTCSPSLEPLSSPSSRRPPPPPHYLHRSPPSPSLPGWLQIGYFLHAPSRALISGRVLIVGLSLRLTDSWAPALLKRLIWSMFVCGALSPHLILTALTVCAGSLSPSCCSLPPPSVSISVHSLYSLHFGP